MKNQGKRWKEIYLVCLPDISHYERDPGLDQKQAQLRQRQDQVNLRTAVRQELRRSKLKQTVRQGEKPEQPSNPPKKESLEGYGKIEGNHQAALPSERNNLARSRAS